MSERRTRLDRIKTILERDGCIANLYASQNKVSYRLGARIYDLCNAGYVIRTEDDETGNAVYYLINKPEPKQLHLV